MRTAVRIKCWQGCRERDSNEGTPTATTSTEISMKILKNKTRQKTRIKIKQAKTRTAVRSSYPTLGLCMGIPETCRTAVRSSYPTLGLCISISETCTSMFTATLFIVSGTSLDAHQQIENVAHKNEINHNEEWNHDAGRKLEGAGNHGTWNKSASESQIFHISHMQSLDLKVYKCLCVFIHIDKA